MVEFITGASGTGKTTLMFERIKQFQNDGKEVCVLVPEQYSNDFDKKLYFSVGAENFNNMLSLTFSSLARQLFQLYGDPNRSGAYADDIARMIIIYQAVSAAKADPEMLKFFTKRSSQNGFAEEILKIITDMKHSGINSEDLFRETEFLKNKLRDKTSDIAYIYSEYERIMQEYGFKDMFDNIREAAEIAGLHEFFKGKCVCLDEFESFNADQLEMIEKIFRSAENVVITLRTDDVKAGSFTLFETVNDTYRKLVSMCRKYSTGYKLTQCGESMRFRSDDLKYISDRVMRSYPCEPDNAPEVRNVRIFEARDMYSETEYICAEIKRLISADKSLKYRDIAVISNKIEDYADILKAAFERYDIPYFLSIKRSVNHTAVIVFFTSLLDLLTARKFHSEHIFRLLKCGILDESLTEISLLENYCYKWGIDGDVWNDCFTASDDNLEIIENLRERTLSPIIVLRKKLRKKMTAEEICAHLYNYLTECGAERTTGRLINQLIKSGRDHDASELKRIWSCLIRILDSIADTIGENITSISKLAGIMRSLINTIDYSVPPQTLDSVMTASARTARLDSPKIVFAIGSAEGDFPNSVSLHGLFSDSDKQELAENHGLRISRPLAELVSSEQLIVYKSLSAASDKLYITYPRSDLGGNAKYPAPVIAQLRSMFRDKKPIDKKPDFYTEDRNRLFVSDDMLTPDFYAVTMKAAYYHYMQDRAEKSPAVAAVESLLLSDNAYRQKVTSVLGRSASSTDYKVRTETMEKLRSFRPLVLSPSGIEKYNECHFQYFCGDFLKLRMPEKIEINPLVSGNLAHECFHQIIQSRKTDFTSLTDDEISVEVGRCADMYRKKELGGDFSKTPRFELFFNKLKEQLIEIFIHTREAFACSDFIPDRFEINIYSNQAVHFDFAGDCRITFKGKIDRADVFELDGVKYLRIIDYKSSVKDIDTTSLANGINLQMLLYLFIATEEGGVYGEYVPAGVLYTPVRISSIKEDKSKNPAPDSESFDKSLKSTGLLIDNIEVLRAMEHGLHGRFIPAEITDKGAVKSSSLITSENMDKLREFIYKSIIEMAESVHSGNIEAVPFVKKGDKKIPCNLCDFGDICGNSGGAVCHGSDEEKEAEVSEILNGKKKGDGRK